ncbi:MAG: 5'-3' exonuclease H3TH domain-containing protein [Anaerovoracaceae bacterium]
MEKRIIIIDGNSLINRAYYAMQKPMITKDGLYTQGVYGFINMLDKIKKEHPAGYIAVAFDLKAPTFRHKEYDGYKAGRKSMPTELAMQMPLIKDVLVAMNIKILEEEGFEADDIIGTVAREAEAAGLAPLIITGDKDELQLATKITKVMITKKGISEFALYDEDQMIEEYGFTPTQFIDYKGLMGDPSDNIPGLPGVGPKTAQKLILEYGSVEGLLENTEQLKGKLKTTVEENAQLAVMSKRLATIHTGVPLEIDFESYRWREPDHDALVDHYVKLEFNRFLKKLKGSGSQGVAAEEAQGEVQGRAEAAVNRIVEEEINQSLVQSAAFPQALLDAIGGEAPLVMKVFGDDNHKARPQIYGVALLCEREYFYLNTGAEGVLSTFVQQMKEHRPKLMGHELKKDYYQLMHEGLEELDTAFDTAIGEYVLDAGRSSYDIVALFQEYFHSEIEAEEEI